MRCETTTFPVGKRANCHSHRRRRVTHGSHVSERSWPSFRMAAAPAALAALPLRTIMVSYGPFLTHLCSRISPRCRRIMGGFKSKRRVKKACSTHQPCSCARSCARKRTSRVSPRSVTHLYRGVALVLGASTRVPPTATSSLIDLHLRRRVDHAEGTQHAPTVLMLGLVRGSLLRESPRDL